MTHQSPSLCRSTKSRATHGLEHIPAALACVLKVEKTLVVCMLPHCGQGGCTLTVVVRSDAQTFSHILDRYTQNRHTLYLCVSWHCAVYPAW